MIINYPDLAPFVEACQPVYTELAGNYGQELMDSVLRLGGSQLTLKNPGVSTGALLPPVCVPVEEAPV
jgi:hypothetical protein